MKTTKKKPSRPKNPQLDMRGLGYKLGYEYGYKAGFKAGITKAIEIVKKCPK